nr:miner inner-capsid protein [Pteropine orthoreovirus]
MAYLALPVPEGPDSQSALISAVNGYRPDGVTFDDVHVLDTKRVLRQFDLMTTGIRADDVAKGLLLRDWRRQSVFVLLPQKTSLLEYLSTATKSSLPDGLTPQLLRKFKNKTNDFKYSDWFSPLVTEHTSVAQSVRYLNSHPVVFTTTVKVIGAPVRLFAPFKYFDISQGILSDLMILKMNHHLPPLPAFRVMVSMFPSSASGSCVLPPIDEWRDLNTHPVCLLLASMYDSSYKATARYLDRSLITAMLCGQRRVKQAKYSPLMARAARSVGLSVNVTNPTRQINTSLIDVHTVVIDVRSSLDNRLTPTRLRFCGVPVALTAHMGVAPSEDWLAVRDETGMFVDWFLVLTLFSDRIKGPTGQHVCLNPLSTSVDSVNFVCVHGYVSQHVQSLKPWQYGRLSSFGVAMAKGSFKSTMTRFLTSLTIAGTRLIFPNVIVDSDDPGDSLDPTFENQVLSELSSVDAEWERRVFTASGTVDMGYLSTVIFPIFLRLFRSELSPRSRTFYDDRASAARTLTFAHADAEFLDAGWVDRIERCYILYDEERNVLLRSSRVGGSTFQLVLSRCYKMIASPAPSEPVSMLLKSLVGGWLSAGPVLSSLPHSASARVLAWYIDDHHWVDHGWCLCDKRKHVTFSFMRGHPDDLAVLDLQDWSKYRATISVLTDPLDFGSSLRVVAARVYWTSQKPSVDVFDNRALLTPFQTYHVSLNCACPLGVRFQVKNVGLKLATVSGA